MNILCDLENSLEEIELYGWAKVFVSCGHDFLFLDRSQKAILDAFEEKKPDIFITHINALNRATKKAIERNDYCKSIVIINQNEDKQKLENKKNIFFISQNNLDCLKIEPSCDIFLCIKPRTELSMISDFSYVGDYVKENVFSKFFSKFRVKCWGKTLWPYPNYLGKIKNEKIKNIICSSTLSFFSDDLKNKNWPLYCYMCNKAVINYKSDWLKSILINNETYFSNEEEMFNEIFKILKNEQKLIENIKSNHEHVKNNHLSHHRVSDILNYIGFSEESKRCLNAVMEMMKKY